ncbi:hypothetical protein C0J52_24315, partial [Blattella germanica]
HFCQTADSSAQGDHLYKTIDPVSNPTAIRYISAASVIGATATAVTDWFVTSSGFEATEQAGQIPRGSRSLKWQLVFCSVCDKVPECAKHRADRNSSSGLSGLRTRDHEQTDEILINEGIFKSHVEVIPEVTEYASVEQTNPVVRTSAFHKQRFFISLPGYKPQPDTISIFR